MNLKRHEFIFNIISGVYDLFFSSQYRKYREIISDNIGVLSVEPGSRVLDTGCGTGAFAKAFSDSGFDVTGVDIASRMVLKAQRRGINCTGGNAVAGLPYEDGSFGLVVMSYVAHGLDSGKRIMLYREAARLSSGKVLIHDYGYKRRVSTDIIEFLEGGCYFSFVKSGLDEMRSVFSSVSVVPVDRNAMWYVCDVRDNSTLRESQGAT